MFAKIKAVAVRAAEAVGNRLLAAAGVVRSWLAGQTGKYAPDLNMRPGTTLLKAGESLRLDRLTATNTYVRAAFTLLAAVTVVATVPLSWGSGIGTAALIAVGILGMLPEACVLTFFAVGLTAQAVCRAYDPDHWLGIAYRRWHDIKAWRLRVFAPAEAVETEVCKASAG